MRHPLLVVRSIPALLLIVVGTLPATGVVAAEPPAKPEKVDLLFVQNSSTTAVDVKKHTMTLRGISPTTLFFSDRPVRIAGHYTTEEFLRLWDEGKDSFLVDPPNATLSVFEEGKADLVDLVVKLRNPRLQGNDLIYDITVMEGQPPKVGGPGSLFIDLFVLRPLMARRAVIYGAAVTSSAAAASMETGPPPQYGGPPPYTGGPPPPDTGGPPPLGAGGPPPAAPGTSATPREKLSELKSLYDQGLISKTEYEAKKQEVLNQLVQ
jgi:hypothetical protein